MQQKIIFLDDENLIVNEGEKRVYSIGYEGKNIDRFVEILKKNEVKQLIDVRERAFSFKKGFSKTPLKTALFNQGISYFHLPKLGTDKASRDQYKKTGNIDELLQLYRKRFNENYDSFIKLSEIAVTEYSAIMCFEDDHTKCHRQVIEQTLGQEGFEVINLCNGKRKGFS